MAPQASDTTSSKRKKKYRYRTGLNPDWFTRWKLPGFTRNASRDVEPTGPSISHSNGVPNRIAPVPHQPVPPHGFADEFQHWQYNGALQSSPGVCCEPAGYDASGSEAAYSLYSVGSSSSGYLHRPTPPAGYAGSEYSPCSSIMTHVPKSVSFAATVQVRSYAPTSNDIDENTRSRYKRKKTIPPIPSYYEPLVIEPPKQWFDRTRQPPPALSELSILHHRHVGLDLMALVAALALALLFSSCMYVYNQLAMNKGTINPDHWYNHVFIQAERDALGYRASFCKRCIGWVTLPETLPPGTGKWDGWRVCETGVSKRMERAFGSQQLTNQGWEVVYVQVWNVKPCLCVWIPPQDNEYHALPIMQDKSGRSLLDIVQEKVRAKLKEMVVKKKLKETLVKPPGNNEGKSEDNMIATSLP